MGVWRMIAGRCRRKSDCCWIIFVRSRLKSSKH